MGYTHYWYTPKELGTKEQFQKFASDCMKILSFCENELGIGLANGSSDIGSIPEITNDLVNFNGAEDQKPGQWTTNEQISIPWPAHSASLEEVSTDPATPKTNGTWFEGHLLTQRCAPLDTLTGRGSGSYETCYIERVSEEQPDYRKGEPLHFSFCKTAYRPYGLAVTAVLIALKHRFPAVKVRSDGEEKDWLDGRFVCNNLLGYGMDEVIGED